MFQSIHHIWFYKNVSISIIGKKKKERKNHTSLPLSMCCFLNIYVKSTSKYTACQENLAERETMNRFSVFFSHKPCRSLPVFFFLQIENYIKESMKAEMAQLQQSAVHNHTAAMLEMGTNLLSQTAEQTRKLTDVETQVNLWRWNVTSPKHIKGRCGAGEGRNILKIM